MVLNDIERKAAERTVGAFIEKRRSPAHIRPELDLGFRVRGQSVELFEIRPRWKAPEKKMEHPVPKATMVRSQGVWKIYWQCADLKWHSYEPLPEVAALDKVLAVVSEDRHACLWG